MISIEKTGRKKQHEMISFIEHKCEYRLLLYLQSLVWMKEFLLYHLIELDNPQRGTYNYRTFLDSSIGRAIGC